MKSRKKLIFCILLAVVAVALLITWLVIYNNPVIYTDMMTDAGRYSDVVRYYNNKDISKEKKDTVDSIIMSKMKGTFSKWEEAELSYEEAYDIMSPFTDINDETICEYLDSSLTYMSIENTGNEALNNAEIHFGNNDYIDAMVCLSEADESYSCYRSLQEIYDESKNILLNRIGIPISEEEYNEAIANLEEYISAVNDEDFVSKKEQLEKELADYKNIQKILMDSTDAFENQNYKLSLEILEEGKEEYPDSNKIEYALSSYQYAYMLIVVGEVEGLLEDKDYDNAIEYLETAITNYDCDQFRTLLDSVKRKDSVFYNIKASLSDAGDYVFRSAKKMVLGDFDKDEQETLLSLGGSIAASLAGADTPLDARDLAYDFSHWGEGDYFAARLALDAIGVIPVLGAVKYIKHIDTAVDVAKAVDKGADVADAVHDTAKVVDEAQDVADVAHDVANAADAVHDASNAVDTAHDIGKAVENGEDALKEVDEIVDDVILDVTKKADMVPDLTDDFSEVAKVADDVGDTAKSITKKGGRYGDVFKDGEGDLYEVHHIPAASASDLDYRDGPCIKMKKEDHKRTASWGSSKEAMQHKRLQKQL